MGVNQTGELRVLASERSCAAAFQDLEFLYQRRLQVERVEQGVIDHTVERLITRSDRKVELQQPDRTDEGGTTDVRNLANEPPVVRYVNLIVRDAYDLAASDIHLEATTNGLRARFRLDGILAAAPEPPADLHRAVISRLKLLADLNIAERRCPQDGRIRVRLDERDLDIRISTVPTVFGESVVLRLLERGGRPIELHELGMPPPVQAAAMAFLQRSHGLLLVTGPTGSGKTTTMYAALRSRDAAREKIMTVEDPVEYQLEGITQVPVHRVGGVTFASALRSILRQDPDVVMIGEMRDRETAEIGVQAAMTGHLVLATLHTNDAVGAIPRLVDLGIPPYLIASTLNCVIAQRLVRKTCPHCCETIEPPAAAGVPLNESDAHRFVRAVGCTECLNTGYRGRMGIFEAVAVDERIRAAIGTGQSSAELTSIWKDSGALPMVDDAMARAALGTTTIDEVLRVTSQA